MPVLGNWPAGELGRARWFVLLQLRLIRLAIREWRPLDWEGLMVEWVDLIGRLGGRGRGEAAGISSLASPSFSELFSLCSWL